VLTALGNNRHSLTDVKLGMKRFLCEWQIGSGGEGDRNHDLIMIISLDSIFSGEGSSKKGKLSKLPEQLINSTVLRSLN
jgi:hypothetical protein